MSSYSEHSSSQGPSDDQSPLRKGKACTNCRYRKIRCDGKKPCCGPCAASTGLFRDCEYADRGSQTCRQQLEERVAILRSQVQELEQPRSSGSVNLYDPYAAPSMPAVTSTSGGSVSSPFHEHFTALGFFLDFQGIRESMSAQDADQHPSQALLHAVDLWNAHISQRSDVALYEAAVLPRIAQQAAEDLSTDHPTKLLHVIQAEVLLAQYFFTNMRMAEAKYHTSAAVSLVLCAGFDQIRPSFNTPDPLTVTRPLVLPALDILEERERIDAFWTVVILNNCWSTTDVTPSGMSFSSSDMRIGTPWPLGQASKYNANVADYDSIQQFLQSGNGGVSNDSLLALLAKASVLFEQATQLSRSYRSGLALVADMHQFLDRATEIFLESFPSFNQWSTPEYPSALVAHGLAHVSRILLQKTLPEIYLTNQRAAASAHSVVTAINLPLLQQCQGVDPVLSTLWMVACQAFISELSRLKYGGPTEEEVPRLYDYADLRNGLDKLMRAMNIVAGRCPIMNFQLNKIRQSYVDMIDD